MTQTPTEHARAFLKTLYPDIPADAQLEIRYMEGSIVRSDWLTRAEEFDPTKYRTDAHVWFGTCLRDKTERRTADHVIYTRCVWADFDKVDDVNGLAARLKVRDKPPSLLVRSGGGLHAYWVLGQLMDLRDASRVQWLREVVYGLAVALKGDTAVHDISRILRVPGTYNCKPEYGEPRYVEWEQC